MTRTRLSLPLERIRQAVADPERVIQRVVAWSNRWPEVRRARRWVLRERVLVHAAAERDELQRWQRRGWISAREAERLSATARELPPPAAFFVALAARWNVGRVDLSTMWHQLGIPGSWIGGLRVHPLWRGSGIGGRLVREVLAVAGTQLGLREVWANVRHTNAASLGLFRTQGFDVVDRPPWRSLLERHYADRGRQPSVRELILRRFV